MSSHFLASSAAEGCPAPTIPEILADPSAMEGREDTVFVVRSLTLKAGQSAKLGSRLMSSQPQQKPK